MENLTLQRLLKLASPDDCRIFHVGNDQWEVRCQAGVYAPGVGLVSLLSILAGKGIYCSVIEWDGLSKQQLDQSMPVDAESGKLAHGDAQDQDLSWHLEQAIQELDLDATGLAHNMWEATIEQLYEIADFADRLKQAALIEIGNREGESDESWDHNSLMIMGHPGKDDQS